MISRRARALLAIAFAAFAAGSHAAGNKDAKVLILGIDGMDPAMLREFAAEGAMPNFAKLMQEGSFSPLATTAPPLSPVAWSAFITGLDPGGHGIFDFVHRDPATMIPYASTSRSHPASRTIDLGSWRLPLAGGGYELLRKGTAFWQMLEAEGVPTMILRMPANFPPAKSPGFSLSGMGTPDVLGTPGTFSFYTNRPPANASKITGGNVYEVKVIDYRVSAQLRGPAHPFKPGGGGEGAAASAPPQMTVDFEVILDPRERAARIEVGDAVMVLNQGEWSDWVRVDFRPAPLVSPVSSICRFYLQQVWPDFRLYASPLQINPENPAMPISTPDDWAERLQRRLGYFHTKELPEETKALTAGIFTGREFWDQLQFVFGEQRRAMDAVLEDFRRGLRFVYFSTVDQGCHMLWRYADQKHPGHVDEADLRGGMKTLYSQLDEALGAAREKLGPEATLIVMSDHGFSPFYRGVNLNSWLLEEGYVRMTDDASRALPYFGGVDWSRTRAYAVGLNGLYANLKGREKDGAVEPGATHEALLDELEAKLLALRDTKDGAPAVTAVVRPGRDFTGPYAREGPDLIVGYAKGYRSSWESPLGEFPPEIFVDNKNAWSGDHSCDPRHVPGILLSNRPIVVENPALADLTVAVLDEFGVAALPEMKGRDCLGDAEPQAGR